jgi:acyl-CoA thioester hydrolase
MYLHIDLGARRVVPWLPEAHERVDAAAAAHSRLQRPGWAGRRITMPTRLQGH